MSDDMGTFRVDIKIENPLRPGKKRALRSVLVDIAAELYWIPAEVLASLGIERYSRWQFRQADGTVVERWTGPAFVGAAGKRTTDDVVFGAPGDLVLLGARSLEALDLRIEPVTRRLVDAEGRDAVPRIRSQRDRRKQAQGRPGPAAEAAG